MHLSFVLLVFFSSYLIGFAFAETDDAQLLSDQGKVLLQQNKFQEAITYFDRVLEIDPNNIDVLNNKGTALAKIGKLDEAITYFDRVLEIDPNIVETLQNKGMVLVEMKKPNEALSYFQKALDLDPDNPIVKRSLEFIGGFTFKKIDGLLEVTVRDSNENLMAHLKSIDISVLGIELTNIFIEENFQKETIFKNGVEKDVFKFEEEFISEVNYSYAFRGLFFGDPPLNIIETHHNQIPIMEGDIVTVVLTLFDLPE